MNEPWLKLLYDANYDMLYRLASNRLTARVGHSSDAQDVIQEVFLLAHRKKIYMHPKPEAWLVVTTVNVCNNYIQANARRLKKYNKCAQEQWSGNVNSMKQPMPPNSDEMQSVDLRIVIEQALSDEERDILEQHYGEGLSMDEISQNMNISPNALKVRMHRIRKKLKKYLQ